MVEKNKRYIIEITDISSDGNGVGTVDGFAVFVPMTAIGDVAEVLIVKVLSHYAVGRLMEILTPSTDRTEPKCSVFKRCGGCQLQHMSYSAQLAVKCGFINAAMQRIGGFSNFVCDDILGMEMPYRYRNKCIFPIGKNKNGDTVSGFYARRSHEIIPVSDCLMAPEINSVINEIVVEFMKEHNISVYDETAHKGLVRRIFIREARMTGEIMVVISVNGKNMPYAEILTEKLKSVSEKIVSIYVNINTEKNNSVLGKKNKLIYGKETINDTLCGTNFKISPHSFYQINPTMTEKLYNRALEYADIAEHDTVLDVYCGIGTISLAAAQKSKKTIGIEIVEQAVWNARENAKDNSIENVEFYADSAESAVPKLIESGMKPDIVIIDPPRKGSDEVTLNAILKAQPKRIVYVSCNPSTLARDARYLADNGYFPTKCTGMDMFPNTSHVETVVLMSRVDG